MKKLSAGSLLITVTFAILLIGFISGKDVLADGTTGYLDGWCTIPVTITGANITSDAWADGYRYKGEVWAADAVPNSAITISGIITVASDSAYYGLTYTVSVVASGTTSKTLLSESGTIPDGGGSQSFSVAFNPAAESSWFGATGSITVDAQVTLWTYSSEPSTRYTDGIINIAPPVTTTVPVTSTTSSLEITTTTTAGPCSVQSFTPAEGAVNVDWENPTITATLSCDIKQDTVNDSTVTIYYQSSKETIPGNCTASGGTIITCKPILPNTGRKIGVTIKGGEAGVKSTSGGTLSADTVWSFTTLPEILVKIIPVQIADDLDFARGKKGMVRVKALWAAEPYGDTEVRDLTADVNISFDGQPGSSVSGFKFWRERTGPADIPGEAPATVHRTGNSVNVAAPFIDDVGEHTVSAEIIPANQNGKPPKSFREKDKKVIKVRPRKQGWFKTTVDYTVLYVPINVGGWKERETRDIKTLCVASNEFAKRILPVKVAEPHIETTVVDVLGKGSLSDTPPSLLREHYGRKINQNLARIVIFTEDQVIGVAPRAWMSKLLKSDGYAGDILYLISVNAALIADDVRNMIAAHEIGHCLGYAKFTHNPDTMEIIGYNIDANQYVNYPNDTTLPRTYDLMIDDPAGAGGQLWLAKQTCEFLLGKLTSSGGWFGSVFPAQQEEAVAWTGVLYISGELCIANNTETVTVDPIYVLSEGNAFDPEQSGDYSIELQDSAGAVLNSISFAPEFIQGEGGNQYGLFLYSIPFMTKPSRVLIKHGSTVLLNIPASSNAPSVTITSPQGAQVITGITPISWNASDADGDALKYNLLYSSNNGQTWRLLAHEITEMSYTLDTAQVSNGEQCMVKVIATDGFNTTEAVSAAFTIKNTPIVYATVPSDSETGVSIDGSLLVKFRDPMGAATINTSTILLQDEDGASVSGTVTYESESRQAVFTPGSTLTYGTTYTGTVKTGVKDTAGTPLSAEYIWTFTTVEEPSATTTTASATTTSVPGGICPLEKTVENKADLELIRAFRDTKLNNAAGLNITSLYYKHAAEANFILDVKADLKNSLSELVAKHIGTAQKLVAGETVTISKAEVDEITDFLKALKASAGKQFGEDIDVIIKGIEDGSLLKMIGVSLL